MTACGLPKQSNQSTKPTQDLFIAGNERHAKCGAPGGGGCDCAACRDGGCRESILLPYSSLPTFLKTMFCAWNDLSVLCMTDACSRCSL